MFPDFTPSPDLYPFTSRHFDAPAGRMHYVDEGEGPALLLLHGNPTWSFQYRNVVLALRDRFRCIAPDHLGFGLSERPDGYGYTPAEHADQLGAFVEALELGDLVVVAHDWGGPIGTRVAADHAERIRGLTYGTTWCWPSGAWFNTFSRIMSSGPMQRRIIEDNFFVKRLIPLATTRKLSEQEMAHYTGVQSEPALRTGVAVFPGQIRLSAPWLAQIEIDARARLADKRVLFTWPMRDYAFRFSSPMKRFQSIYRDSVVVELPKAGHFFAEDAPDGIARAIGQRFG